jgi:lysine/ornithine N-monooxygenase
MSRADDLLSSVQKAVGDGPLQLLVGVGDLVSEKLRELPEAVTTWQEENRDFPMRAAGALIGSAFRANLKVGELYDELTRRGADVMTKMRGDEVFAEEDEPFVHEPFMPEPVRRVSAASSNTAKKAASRKAATKKAATATASTATASTKSAATKSAATKSAATKSAAKKATTKNVTKKAVTKKSTSS